MNIMKKLIKWVEEVCRLGYSGVLCMIIALLALAVCLLIVLCS